MLQVALQKKRNNNFLLAKKHLRIRPFKLILTGTIAFVCILFSASFLYTYSNSKYQKEILGALTQSPKEIYLASPVADTPTPIPPTFTPTPTPTRTPKKIFKRVKKITPTPTPSSQTQDPKYTAEKIGDVTWKVKNIATDNTMASSQDIVNALNSYRGSHGKSNLIVDSYLTSFAQDRANQFSSSGGLDSHAGFRSFMDNGGFDKAGFNSLGENSAYLSGPMNGEKIVKNIFGADPSHDGNQLNDWTHVGVGVSGNAINVNFGKGKR